MTIACYCRVSTSWSESSQRREIQQWLSRSRINPGSVHWFVDKQESQPSFNELEQLLSDVSRGSVRTVVVCDLDRLSCSFHRGIETIVTLLQHGARLVATSQQVDIDGRVATSTASLVRAISAMECSIHREKFMRGVHAAKAKGVYKGRKRGAVKAGVDPQRAIELKAAGLTFRQISQELGISSRTAMRYLKSHKTAPSGLPDTTSA